MTDRLLDGAMVSDDAPPAYRLVAQALETMRAAATPAELTGERAAVASIAANIAPASPRRTSRFARAPRRFAVAAASLLAGASVFSGLAAADALPRPAQHVASTLLHDLGITVPDPTHHTDTHLNDHSPTPHNPPPTTMPANSENADNAGTRLDPPSTEGDQQGGPLPTDNSVASPTPPASAPAAPGPNAHANPHATAGPGNANGHDTNAPGNAKNSNQQPPDHPASSNNPPNHGAGNTNPKP